MHQLSWGNRSVWDQCHRDALERDFYHQNKGQESSHTAGGARKLFQLHSSLFSPHGAPWKAFCWDAWWAQAVPVRKLKDCSVFGDGFPQQSEELRSHPRLDSWRSQAELWVVPVTSLSRPASAVHHCPSSRLLHAVTSLLL